MSSAQKSLEQESAAFRPAASKWFLLSLLLVAAAASTFSSAHGLRAAPPAKGGAKGAAAEDETTVLLQESAAIAEKAYRAEFEGLTKTRRIGGVLVQVTRSPEEVYTWSVRWLKAQQELSAKPEDQIAALEAHLERMGELKATVKQLVADLLPPVKTDEAEFYRLEAELWLARAKSKRAAAR